MTELRKLSIDDGMDKALVTVHLDNAASKEVALANGGVITGQTEERFLIWIDTAFKN
ncbi:MAG: hypothetical protein HDR21_14365 [Lachnospiraceae bacterium]|nr:hypothetical protein [Lachnospiraceae bacterium]